MMFQEQYCVICGKEPGHRMVCVENKCYQVGEKCWKLATKIGQLIIETKHEKN